MGNTGLTDTARGRLDEQPSRALVDFERCASLLVSRRPLQRADERVSGLQGLFDRSAGVLYVIAADQLARSARVYSS